MKKFKITSRDFLFFFFGLITMFVLVIAHDWEDVKKGFHAGQKAYQADQPEASSSIEKSE